MPDCGPLLEAHPDLSLPGFTKRESADALCAAANVANPDRPLTPRLARAMRTTRWPGLSKAVVGGITHLVSVDNAANYAELWYRGGSYYAVTGAELVRSADGGVQSGIYQIGGVTRGAPLTKAMPAFLEAAFGKGCNCGGGTR